MSVATNEYVEADNKYRTLDDIDDDELLKILLWCARQVLWKMSTGNTQVVQEGDLISEAWLQVIRYDNRKNTIYRVMERCLRTMRYRYMQLLRGRRAKWTLHYPIPITLPEDWDVPLLDPDLHWVDIRDLLLTVCRGNYRGVDSIVHHTHKATYAQIGKDFGVGKERARQLECKVYKHVREYMNENDILPESLLIS